MLFKAGLISCRGSSLTLVTLAGHPYIYMRKSQIKELEIIAKLRTTRESTIFYPFGSISISQSAS